MKLGNILEKRQVQGVGEAWLQTKSKRMTLEMGLVALFASAGLLAWLNPEAFTVLVTGRYEGTAVKVPLLARLLFPALFLIVVLAMGQLHGLLKGVTDDAKLEVATATKREDERRARLAEQLAEQEKQNAKKEVEQRAAEQKVIVDTLQQSLVELHVNVSDLTRHHVQLSKRVDGIGTALNETLDVIIASESVDYGEISAIETKYLGVDAKGKATLLAVAHLFKGQAQWAYESPVSFENGDGKIWPFMSHVERSPKLMSELQGHYIVIGVGLDSNSPRKLDKMSERRARNLCGQLNALVSPKDKAKVLGMSIGRYTGTEVDKASKRIPDQRTVLILGIRKNTSKAFTDQEVVAAVLKQVGLPGANLRAYSGFAEGASPTWYEVTECGTGKSF